EEEIVAAAREVLPALSGRIEMAVDARTVGDEILWVPTSHAILDFGEGGRATSDERGEWTLATDASLEGTTTLRGTGATVVNYGPDALLPFSAEGGGTSITLRWDDGGARAAERDTYRAIERARETIASVFPDLSLLTAPIRANVGLPLRCNAFWDGKSINFFQVALDEEGQVVCHDTGRILDVILHEIGHAIDQYAPGGRQDGALGEFIGDLFAWVHTDSPQLAPNFFGNGDPVRDLSANLLFPRDIVGQVHHDGLVLGSTMWDLWETLRASGIEAAQLRPPFLAPIADAQTLLEWYDALRFADDDNGDLSDGTPNECAIWDVFARHSVDLATPGLHWPLSPMPECPDAPPRLFFERRVYPCAGEVVLYYRNPERIGA
ncbi:MAG: hypothetical protein D6795_10815, partial [Deltaproteobacteria bacterium]